MKSHLLMMSTALAASAAMAAGTRTDASQSGAMHPPTAQAKPGRAEAGRPLALVAAANSAALLEPSAGGYLNAEQVYPWETGRVYRLFTAPGNVSDIALQPGEALTSIAAGDTVRWVIGNTTSGSGASKQTHILVKPGSANLRTNLVIATDRRVYLVELKSTAGPAMTAISWSYPADSLLALDRAGSGGAAEAAVADGLNLDRLDFGYSIEGDRPSWRPVRAFDDDQQVFIEFPPSLAAGEAPPLFVIGSSGNAELVNYRVRGHYYVVDRLFTVAELRLGEKRQQVVRIVRSGRPDDRGGAPS